MSTLNFEPLISPILWVTLALWAVGVMVWYGWKRPVAVTQRRWIGILVLMTAGLAMVLVILLNPTWTEPIPPPAGKPLMTVLVDVSGSMATADTDDERTRFQAAARIAETMQQELSSRFDVRVRTFAASNSTATAEDLTILEPDGSSTDLASAIAESLEDDRPQGQAVMLLSDGIHNVPGGVASLLNVLRIAKAMAVPVYTKTLGGDAVLNDLEVHLARPQELAFVGQSVPVTVMLRQRGSLADKVNVVLRYNSDEIAQRPVELTTNGTSTVQFNVKQEKSGLFQYEVSAEHLSNETTTANNSASFVLRVIDKPIRLLLLEGKPYWDAKFLMRTLALDPSLELDSIVRLRENRFLKRSLRLIRSPTSPPASQTDLNESVAPAVPVRRVETTEILSQPAQELEGAEGLDSYQIVVLGRNAEVYLTDLMLDRLRTWISHDGGSLVCYRGSPVASVNQTLARLLPLRWRQSRESRFRVQLTERGRSLNWLASADSESEDAVLAKLPSLVASAIPERTKPLSVVLARSEGDVGSPVVTYQPYGTGRVVTVEGAGMWRWAFLAPQYRDHDDVYGSLWQSLLRWLVTSVGLVPGQDLALRVDKVSFTAGESVTATLLLREELEKDAVPTVELLRLEETAAKTFTPAPLGDEPGVYQLSFGQLPQGRYRATVVAAQQDKQSSSASVAFDVRPYLGERLDVQARPDIMSRIARDSGGAAIEDANPSAIAQRFREHIARSRPERIRRLKAWDRWWVLLGVFGLWGIAWSLRRSGGLI